VWRTPDIHIVLIIVLTCPCHSTRVLYLSLSACVVRLVIAFSFSLPLLHEPRPSQVKKQTQLIKRAVQVYTRCITNLEDERLNTSTTRQVGERSLRQLLPPASYAARTRAQKALSARTRKPVRVSSAAVRRAAVCAASVRAPWANPGVWFFTSPEVGW